MLLFQYVDEGTQDVGDNTTLPLVTSSQTDEILDEDCGVSIYYTFLLRHYGHLPTAGDMAYVVENDHTHVLFRSSPKNSLRKMQSIIDKCDVDCKHHYFIKSSQQLVRNVGTFLRYMKSRGEVVFCSNHFDQYNIGREMHWPHCSTLPRELRRSRAAQADDGRFYGKRERNLDLAVEVIKRNVRSVSSLPHHFSMEE